VFRVSLSGGMRGREVTEWDGSHARLSVKVHPRSPQT
jgi:hypothetical protein